MMAPQRQELAVETSPAAHVAVVAALVATIVAQCARSSEKEELEALETFKARQRQETQGEESQIGVEFADAHCTAPGGTIRDEYATHGAGDLAAPRRGVWA